MRRSLACLLLIGAAFPLMAAGPDETMAQQTSLMPGDHAPPGDIPAASSTPADPKPVEHTQPQNNGQHTDPDSFPKGLPPKISPLSPDRPLNGRARVAVNMATRWRQHFVRPVMGDDGRLHFVWGSGEPTVVCSVMHWCDIALQPGEELMQPPNLGDSRWLAHLERSGSGRSTTTHIVVKPSDVGLSTNISAQTNRRSYSIELQSRTYEYMPLVAFDYPQSASDTANDWRRYNSSADTSGTDGGVSSPAEACDQEPAIPPSAYKIGSGKFPWRPLQVYVVSTPVGMKTCIEFPSDIGSRELPSLVALSDDETWFSAPTKQMENFAYVGRRYIVDGELDRFALIQGVGSSQDKIRITRRAAE